MSWGALYFYYECERCGKKYKYAIDMISEYKEEFGKCPECGNKGKLVKEGARTLDDLEYEEVE